MAQCNKCGNQDLEWKEGTTKTGKNIGSIYKAWFCKPCKNMMFIPTPKSPNGNPDYSKTGTVSTNPNSNLEKKVDEILAILKTTFKPITRVVDEEAPF